MKKFLLILLMIVIGIVGVTLFGTTIHLLCIIDWYSHNGEWIYTIYLTFLVVSLPAMPLSCIVVIAKISETIYHPYE